MTTGSPSPETTTAANGVRRWLPALVLIGLMGAGYALGWHHYLSFKTIGLNYEYLQAYIADHFILALAIYMAIYIAAVALSAPGGLVMTLAGGLLFGWRVGIPATCFLSRGRRLATPLPPRRVRHSPNSAMASRKTR